MSTTALKTLFAAAALAAGLFAAPLTASASGYGYDNGYGYDQSSDSYSENCPRSYQRTASQSCHWESVRYYDEYYGEYRTKRVRVCNTNNSY